MSYAYYEAGGNVSVSEADYIDLADVDAVREQLGDMAEAVTGVMSSWDSITIDGNPRQMRILGSDELYRQARNLEVLDGRFLDQSDLESRAKVCLLTPDLAISMYGSMRNALDNSLMIHDLEFRVVGVFQESVDTFGQSELSSYSVLVPITVMGYFQSFERIDPLYVSVRSQQQVEKAAVLVRNTLELRNRPGSRYRVETLVNLQRAARKILLAMGLVMSPVAAVTLAISGIFIMNMMLIAVSERTREIGIRMAVGATRQEIRLQFLAEAAVLALLGGVCGVFLGSLLPWMAELLWPQLPIQIPLFSVFLALLVAAGTGVVFGLLPANRASKLDPVEALRHE